MGLIGDADGDGAANTRVLQDGIGIRGLARLRNADHQHLRQIEGAFVQSQNGRGGQRDRYPGGDLDQVPAELSGIVGRTAKRKNLQLVLHVKVISSAPTSPKVIQAYFW